MRASKLISFAVALSAIIPSSAFALEGIGPRVTVTGIVEQINISSEQAFSEEGGEIVLKATNGQTVNIVLTKDTQIISEGRLSRKYMIPANVVKGMQVRVRGWRVNSNSLTASLLVIMNIELNPVLSQNGVLTAINGNQVTILSADGQNRTYSVTNETEVNINYTLYGADALTLVGKQVLLTLNPSNPTLVRIIRVTGNKPVERTAKPTTIDLGVRTID